MKTEEDKIKYLRRLLNVYLRFSRHYSKVNIIVSSKSLLIVWYEPKTLPWYDFEDKEVPITDLDSQIVSYKGKVEREFKKRNNKK